MIVNVGNECSGEAYQALLEFVAKLSSTFYLINQFQISEKDSPFLSQAEPYLIEERQTSEWPGTRLQGGQESSALMISYGVTRESIKLLIDTCSSLYQWSRWSQPPLPEDLGFVRLDGSVLLASISHENDAWLELDEAELSDFMAVVRSKGIIISY